MSMNFDDPTEQEMLESFYNRMAEAKARENKRSTKESKKAVQAYFPEEGEIKEFSDGAKYIVTKKGWVKIKDKEK